MGLGQWAPGGKPELRLLLATPEEINHKTTDRSHAREILTSALGGRDTTAITGDADLFTINMTQHTQACTNTARSLTLTLDVRDAA